MESRERSGGEGRRGASFSIHFRFSPSSADTPQVPTGARPAGAQGQRAHGVRQGLLSPPPSEERAGDLLLCLHGSRSQQPSKDPPLWLMPCFSQRDQECLVLSRLRGQGKAKGFLQRQQEIAFLAFLCVAVFPKPEGSNPALPGREPPPRQAGLGKISSAPRQGVPSSPGSDAPLLSSWAAAVGKSPLASAISCLHLLPLESSRKVNIRASPHSSKLLFAGHLGQHSSRSPSRTRLAIFPCRPLKQTPNATPRPHQPDHPSSVSVRASPYCPFFCR